MFFIVNLLTQKTSIMKNLLIVITGLLSIYLVACVKEENSNVPVLTTETVTNITSGTATSGGTIITNFSLISYGLCWNTSGSPTINNDRTCDSVRMSSQYSYAISGLKGGTKYYLRAYAVNTKGIGYGNEISFTTLPASAPQITTTMVSNITSSTVTCVGNISNSGGAPITSSGVCWSTSINPTVTDNKTTDGTLTGEFISPVTGLAPLTTFYLRAYATNSIGTTYGNELSFTTTSGSSSVSDIDGNVYSTVTIGNQVWFQQNLKTTRYNTGDVIGTTTSPSLDISKEVNPEYQWAFDAKESNVPLYGRLYTWFAVNDNRNVCPTGWHVPSNDDWIILTEYLTGNGYGYEGSRYRIAKSMAYTSGWVSDGTPGNVGNDQAGNNSSGFSALPGGFRIGTVFNYNGGGGYWWSATEESTTLAWRGCSLWYGSGFVDNGYLEKQDGYSVRCLKNN
jgi:uncharacterized protein (TIGR02145 family)